MFICNHCPYVIHYHSQIQKISQEYKDKINMVAISSNDIDNYPQDDPQHMQDLWKELGLSFPYLFDETQMVAKAYKAECTPEFYLFNNENKLVYRGRLDSSSPGNEDDIDGKDLRNAIGREVFCENDANCFTLSESIDGSAKHYKIVFGIILGSGCGGGLVIDKKILVGPNAFAGEWGHVPLYSNNINGNIEQLSLIHI